MKPMNTETLKKTYKGDVSWRVLYSRAGATQHKGEIDMSDSEIDAKIAQLKALREQPKDDFDKAIKELKNSEPDYQE